MRDRLTALALLNAAKVTRRIFTVIARRSPEGGLYLYNAGVDVDRLAR